jgi:hypothetical protein
MSFETKKDKSSKKRHAVQETWEFVIAQSLKQLQECEARAARLRVCLAYFQDRKKSGDPFPGLEQLEEVAPVAATHN